MHFRRDGRRINTAFCQIGRRLRHPCWLGALIKKEKHRQKLLARIAPSHML